MEHYMPIVISIVLFLFLTIWSHKKSLNFKRKLGLSLSILSFITSLVYSLYLYIDVCKYDLSVFLKIGLPLWLCNFIAPFAILGFYSLKRYVLGVAFFLSMTANLIACITPELHYSFPHLDYMLFFLMHGFNLIIALYIYFVFHLRPKWSDYWFFVLIAHLLVIGSYFLNISLDSNYNYTVSKPSTGSMLDSAGDWPYYLIFAQVTGFVSSFIFFIVLRLTQSKEDDLTL